ncbi:MULTISPECIES: alpha/beta hydrolase fold domain-containing protein [unclassified Streptomyces]|uniref:alpha/beta hydrolase fold domain-containing protein n=1 Tax=unclassified Streptomyces TaxID=2593676 RepID=UPI002E2D93C1|nr:alpha/beta hydrolase fold domain-containing protein [Streptomyces sp. NBC_01429]
MGAAPCDQERVAVGGSSAGAGLAACLAQRLYDTGGTQPVGQWLSDLVPGAPHGFETWAPDTLVARSLLERGRAWSAARLTGANPHVPGGE